MACELDCLGRSDHSHSLVRRQRLVEVPSANLEEVDRSLPLLQLFRNEKVDRNGD